MAARGGLSEDRVWSRADDDRMALGSSQNIVVVWYQEDIDGNTASRICSVDRQTMAMKVKKFLNYISLSVSATCITYTGVGFFVHMLGDGCRPGESHAFNWLGTVKLRRQQPRQSENQISVIADFRVMIYLAVMLLIYQSCGDVLFGR